MRQDLLTLAATCPISSDRSRPRQELSQKAIPISTKHKQVQVAIDVAEQVVSFLRDSVLYAA